MRTRKRERSPLNRFSLVGAVLIAGGCTHYWERPWRSHRELRAVERGLHRRRAEESLYAVRSMEPIYRTCMRGKGWKRVEVSVADNNQFRGPEGEGDFLESAAGARRQAVLPRPC